MPVFREELPVNPISSDQESTIELAGRKYTYRLRWNERLGDWRMDFSFFQGAPIFRGKRISPNESVSLGSLDVPVLMSAEGPDPYIQSQLGNELKIYIFTEE